MDQLWTRILNSKYGGWRNLDDQRRSTLHSHWWKDLRHLNQQEESAVLKEQIEWKVGCRDNIRFWEDKWTAEDRPLTERFPSLYQISNQKQQTISLLGSHRDEGWIMKDISTMSRQLVVGYHWRRDRVSFNHVSLVK